MALETEDLVLAADTALAGVVQTFSTDVGAKYWLVEADGALAGQLMITVEWSDWRNCFVWWVQSVYIWPDFRGQGLFRILYAAVRAAAVEAGAAGIRLYVDRSNTGAQAVYDRIGMDGNHYRVFEDMFDDA